MTKPISQPRPPHQGGRMTYEEFLEWVDEDTLAEWVVGEIAMASPANLREQLRQAGEG